MINQGKTDQIPEEGWLSSPPVRGRKLERVTQLEMWFAERHTDHLKLQVRVRETLHREKSRYQDIAVLDTDEFGRVLVLDGIIQTTERDEFFYHEIMAHIPLSAHPDPRRVLVVGGGDGGSVREALKHDNVEEVHLVEIDERVVAVCEEYLPSLSHALRDKRVNIRFPSCSLPLSRTER